MSAAGPTRSVQNTQLKCLTLNNSGRFQLISEIFAQLFCLCCCHFGSESVPEDPCRSPGHCLKALTDNSQACSLMDGTKKGMKGH